MNIRRIYAVHVRCIKYSTGPNPLNKNVLNPFISTLQADLEFDGPARGKSCKDMFSQKNIDCKDGINPAS